MITIIIIREQLDELLEMQQRNSPFNFSCNRRRRVWPTPGLGYTREEDRDYVKKGEYPLLDEIVEIVVATRYLGGRFYLTNEGAFLSDNDEQFVEFDFE